MRYLEDLVVGEERLSKSVRVSAKEIIEFAKKFDPQPFTLILRPPNKLYLAV
jgi:hypothetical protein